MDYIPVPCCTLALFYYWFISSAIVIACMFSYFLLFALTGDFTYPRNNSNLGFALCHHFALHVTAALTVSPAVFLFKMNNCCGYVCPLALIIS
jgi:hypothetical protein